MIFFPQIYEIFKTKQNKQPINQPPKNNNNNNNNPKQQQQQTPLYYRVKLIKGIFGTMHAF